MSRRVAWFVVMVGLGCAAPEGGSSDPVVAPSQAAVTAAIPEARREASQAELKQTLSRRLSRAPAGMKTEALPGGGTLLRTGEGFHHVSVVSRGADGVVRRTCLGTRRELEALMPEVTQ